jgi:hypothetical protein
MRRDAEQYARQGDPTLLIRLGRNGGWDRRLQQLAADLLDGKLKPRHRTIIKQEMRAMAIRDFAWALPWNMALKDRVGRTAERFKVSTRTVYAALKQPADWAPLSELGARYRRPRSCK